MYYSVLQFENIQSEAELILFRHLLNRVRIQNISTTSREQFHNNDHNKDNQTITCAYHKIIYRLLCVLYFLYLTHLGVTYRRPQGVCMHMLLLLLFAALRQPDLRVSSTRDCCHKVLTRKGIHVPLYIGGIQLANCLQCRQTQQF